MALIVGAIVLLDKKGVAIPRSMSFFEFSILVLAAFRITRLVVYDSIFDFTRNCFLDKRGKKYKKGPLLCISELLGCPWCAGVWIALFVMFTYLYYPKIWFFFLFLAIAGLSTFIQLLINLIGWHAEGKKRQVMRMK